MKVNVLRLALGTRIAGKHITRLLSPWVPLTQTHSSPNKKLAIHMHRTPFVGVFQRPSSRCQLALVLGRSDDTGLSRTYVPANPGETPPLPRKLLYGVN